MGCGGHRGAPGPPSLRPWPPLPQGCSPEFLLFLGHARTFLSGPRPALFPALGCPSREVAGAPSPPSRPFPSLPPPPLCSFVAAGHRCFKGDITRVRKARGVELRALLLVFLERPWALDFHLHGTTGPHVSTEDAAMAEGSELVNRLMIENADLRKQVRLMKENQMLKRLLSESCQESCGRGGCDLLIPKAPAYPEACSPCSAGEPGPVSSGGSAPGRRADRLPAWAGGALCPWWPPRCCHRGYKQHVQVHQGQPGGAGGAGRVRLSFPGSRARRARSTLVLGSFARRAGRQSRPVTWTPRQEWEGRPGGGSCSITSRKLQDCRTRKSFYLNEIQSFAGTEKDGRIVGEIAFQLDWRILAYVFPGVTRLYGFTVSNIPEKIKQTSIKSLDGSVDEKKRLELTHRYLTLTACLERLGYKRAVHPVFSEFLINTYGILKQRPDLRANPLHSSPAALCKLVIDVVPPKFLGDSLLLLNCLCELSKEDGRPLFAW
ncbi:speriolin-like protein [Tursiops truncatus]|uniref:speriolin-like protein n=1 Tax=Tursiops truncatus TaxID=9739 RepID=UPI003CCFA5F8